MDRRYSLAAAFILLIFFSFLPSSFAIYQWVDENGTVHLTDYPKPGKQPAGQEHEDAASPADPAKKTDAPSRDVLDAKQPASPQGIQPTQQNRPATSTAGQPPAGTEVKQPLAQSQTVKGQPRQAPTSQPAGIEPQPAPGPEHAGTEGPYSNAPVAVASNEMSSANNGAALVAGFLSTFLLVMVGLYLYGALCLYLIAKKLNVPAAWTAWIPILQTWAFLSSAGKPLWWVLLFFVPLVNAFVGVYLWICITENLGKNKMLGLLMLIPVANLIFLGVLAFSQKEETPGVAPAF